MSFVFVVCVFCSVSNQISYAKKGRDNPNVQVTQKGNGGKSGLPEKWKPNSDLKEFNKYKNMSLKLGLMLIKLCMLFIARHASYPLLIYLHFRATHFLVYFFLITESNFLVLY